MTTEQQWALLSKKSSAKQRLKHLRLTNARMLRAEQEHLLLTGLSCMLIPETIKLYCALQYEVFWGWHVGIAQFCSRELQGNYQQMNISFDQEGSLH